MRKRQKALLWALGGLAVVWLGLLLAPYLERGLPYALSHLDEMTARPFRVTWCASSAKTVLVLLGAAGLGAGILLTSRRPERQGAEHGSARWGDPEEIRKRYADSDRRRNKILTAGTAVSLDQRRHMHNLNVLVCGGSGSGKTRFYAKPNVLNAKTSFVILDPKTAGYAIIEKE